MTEKNNPKSDNSFIAEMENYNFLKMFETSKASNTLIYQPSNGLYNNLNSSNLFTSNTNNDNYSTNSSVNEKVFNSWGYSNSKQIHKNAPSN